MAQKSRPGSWIAATVYGDLRRMFAAGLIGAHEMAEAEATCLVAVPHYLGGRRIRKIRRRCHLSQERMAALLGTRVATLRRWELGVTQPRGHARRVLDQLEAGGLGAVAGSPGPRRRTKQGVGAGSQSRRVGRGVARTRHAG